ncbi:MAG: serine hydrolase [Pseudomonadota bacterium]
MTVFNPSALTATPNAVAQALVANGAPAALVSIYDGAQSGHAVAGVSAMDDGTPAQLGQTFEAGSQTKMVTAVVVLKLVEAGLLSLDDTLADHLPAGMLDGIANADTATIRDVLAMRSGIPDFTSLFEHNGLSTFDLITAENPDTVIGTEVALDLVRGAPASFEPGTDYQYCNTGYALLGELIEAVTGAPLAAAMDALVFEPLGIENTWLDDQTVDDARLSSYFGTEDDVFDVTDALQDLSAEGGLISTTADMMTFVQALLVDQTLLSPSLLAQMTTFQPTGTEGMSFGLGLFGFDLGSEGTLMGFTGGTLGTSTATFLHVETGRIISTAVTMTNLEVSGASGLSDTLSLLTDDPAWSQVTDSSPIEGQGVSAADLDVTETQDGFEIAADGAGLQINTQLASIDEGDMLFEDGSVLRTGDLGHNRIVLTQSDNAHGMDNQLMGLSGHDTLKAGSGNDKLLGGEGQDKLVGSRGHDALFGGKGSDRLFGGKGNDVLDGGAGHDRQFGGLGNDFLIGGFGDDMLKGGEGADVFVFGDATDNGRADFDRIRDFDVAVDLLFVGDAEITDATETQSGLLLTFAGDGDVLFLQGVTDADALVFV